MKLQVHRNGMVTIIDAMADAGEGQETYGKKFKTDNGNSFRVRWEATSGEDFPFPRFDNGACSSASCTVHTQTSSCICDIRVSTSIVYASPNVLPASRDMLVEKLFVGSPPVSAFPTNMYTKCTSSACTSIAGVEGVYTTGGSATPTVLDATTIFEVASRRAGGDNVFLMNKISMVNIDGDDSKAFRNPPHFMPLLGEEWDSAGGYSATFSIPQAEHETNALLTHLFEHDNTAPFVTNRLIQRMTTSNPSPRYVETCATAFATGVYEGRTYSGKYGDMGALARCILLDREARDPLLDHDPYHGKLHEPILKIIQILRALDYRAHLGRPLFLPYIQADIGQQFQRSPTVFNFFLAEYAPPGVINDAQLVAPEAELLTSPLIMGFLNGISSLAEYGLTTCQYGFADGISVPKRANCNVWKNQIGIGNVVDTADGVLDWSPTAGWSDLGKVVDELSTLLTSGRMRRANRAIITRAMQEAYDAAVASKWIRGATDAEAKQIIAMRRAVMLFMVSSEFHASSANNVKAGSTRSTGVKGSASQGRKYKAIVVVFLQGAADSFHMLVPHSGCRNGVDLYQEYQTMRGASMALAQDSLLQIDTTKGDFTQPCSKFGLHPELSNIQRMYNAGTAAWIANMGSLVQPTSKTQFKEKSAPLPPSLFAHNIMQRSIQNMHPQKTSADGVLGRLLRNLDFASNLYSISGNKKILEGSPQPASIISSSGDGVQRFRELGDLGDEIRAMHRQESHSIFDETWSSQLNQTLVNTENLGKLMSSSTSELSETFPDTSMGNQMRQVAKLIKLRGEIGSERDGFLTALGGWDSHNKDITETGKITEIDEAIAALESELIVQGVWEDTTVLMISDFGRTLTSNGLGTDHAWGGNYFVLGGGVRGDQILGQYPTRLLEEHSDVNIGRGRVLPTTSFEHVWAPICKWFGVDDEKMKEVLPNAGNFNVFSVGQLYQ